MTNFNSLSLSLSIYIYVCMQYIFVILIKQKRVSKEKNQMLDDEHYANGDGKLLC